MESRKQLMNKATDVDNLITKAESELRIINVGIVTSSILIIFSMVLIGIWLIGVLVHSSSTNTPTNSSPLAIVTTEKLYVIYTNGLVVDFQLTKNMQFQELKSQKFPNNKCGHFGFYDIDKLFAFVGSEKKLGYYLEDSLIKPIIG